MMPSESIVLAEMRVLMVNSRRYELQAKVRQQESYQAPEEAIQIMEPIRFVLQMKPPRHANV